MKSRRPNVVCAAASAIAVIGVSLEYRKRYKPAHGRYDMHGTREAALGGGRTIVRKSNDPSASS